MTLAYSEEYKKVLVSAIDKSQLLLFSQDLTFERNKKLRLRDEIDRMISASKLEGHPEIAIVLEQMRDIVDSTISGSMLLNDRTSVVIKQGLANLREALVQNKHYSLNTEILEQLKSVSRSTKREESDFVFKKNLKVLCVDNDEFAQMNIKKNAGKTIDITSCLSAHEARYLLSGPTRFDALMSELRLSDANGFDLIHEFASKLPVIAISTADDPKIIQSAVKAGASDYIVKDEVGVKWIPRSLHTAVNNWTKRPSTASSPKRADAALDNPQARKILQYMLQNPKPIKQFIDPALVTDAQSSSPYLKELGKGLLDLLEDEGYIVKSQVAMTVACPQCKSIRITNRYQCQRCSSINFVKGDVLEHNKCGYAGLEHTFSITTDGKDGELTCPKCRKQLRLIGVDYFRIESAYTCKDCNNISTSLDHRLSCMQCGHSNFKVSQAGWQSLYEYRINEKMVYKLKGELTSLEKLYELLSNRGFKVDTSRRIETKYGSFGPFDIVAKRQMDNVIVLVLTGDVNENFARLLDLDNATKIADDNTSKFAILFSEPNEIMRNMLKKFDVSPVFGESEESIVREFRRVLSDRWP